MIAEELRQAVKGACKELFGVDVEPSITQPNEQFGDYATSVALQLAKQLNKTPDDISQKLTPKIERVSGVSVATFVAGFINIKLDDEAIAKTALSATNLPKPLKDQEILVEFGDPNPFKEMHIGHAYSYIAGDAIASLLESAGAKVHRLSYHGDIGLHVAKATWGLKKESVKPNSVARLDIGHYYAVGAKAYESDERAKAEIDEINNQIYKHSNDDINKLYEWGKAKSLANFELTLDNLTIHKPKQYFESQAATIGSRLVELNTPNLFEPSDGAIIFRGEKAGLHTRVFITSQGLPTYETKDLGLAALKDQDYPEATQSLIVTAHEQAEYFKVMLAALKEVKPRLAEKTRHLYHGFVSLSSGKMSSRTGEVYGAVNLIDDVDKAVKKAFKKESKQTRNAGIKYGFLRQRLGSDIIYNVNESVNLEGNSGPYLQYAHARACSIISKSSSKSSNKINSLDKDERNLARKISQYPDVVEQARQEFLPSHICTYLYELAQTFNRFYENNRVISDDREGIRLKLVKAYVDVLKHGLGLLNIEAPDKV